MIDSQLEKKLKRELFKKSYYHFFKWSFNILFPSEKYEDAFYIKYLCDLYQEEVERIIIREEKTKDIIVNIPPRTSKSLITSVVLLAWAWIKDPTIPMISVSFDDELTLINAQLCKDIIKSDEYQDLFGEIFQIRKDIDSKGYFMNNKGGFRLSKTVGANITGLKGTICVIDDPLNPKTAESEVYRKSINDYYRNSLYNRLTPINLGVRIIIMQRLHEDDTSGMLLRSDPDSYRHICLPAEVSNRVEPKELIKYYQNGLLDPIRLSQKTLNQFKLTLGRRGYSGQYEQTPSPEEGGIIKKEWFDIVEPSTLSREPIYQPTHFIIDSAYTSKQENDPTAIMALYVCNNDIYILDVKEVWMEFPDLIKFLGEYTRGFQISQNSKVFIEGAASGKSIIQQLRATTNLNVIEIDKPRDDKITRTHSITPKLESKRAKLVRGQYTENFLDQLASFPTGKHDDMLDCLIHAVTELLINCETPDIMFLDW